jgi:hypothetical protein
MTGQRLSYSVGFPLPHNTSDLLELILAGVWTPAYDAHEEIRDGAWVAELTGLLDLTGWPDGMRVIVGKERPHPGAQLRITDVDGHRVTAFATNTKTGGHATQLPDLELRHRRRARCEDRIRISKDTGLMNLPLQGFAQNPDLVRHRGPGRGDHRVDADARPERASSQALGTKTIALRLFTPPATIAHTADRSVSTSRPKPPGPTSSTTASSGYEHWPSPVDVHPTRPNNHRATPGHPVCQPWVRHPLPDNQ